MILKHLNILIDNDFIFLIVLANFVPAAAVIREGQTLFGFIGRKGFVNGKSNFY